MSEGYKPPVSHLLRPDADRRRSNLTKPKAHEEGSAKALGGRVTPASGAIEGFKGDVADVERHVFDFLVECKRTEGKSLRLETRWLDKITREAAIHPGRSPAMDLQFEGLRNAENEWIAVPRSVFVKMLEILGMDAEELGL